MEKKKKKELSWGWVPVNDPGTKLNLLWKLKTTFVWDRRHPFLCSWGFLSLQRLPHSALLEVSSLHGQARGFGWLGVQLQGHWAQVHFDRDLWSPGMGPSLVESSWFSLCQSEWASPHFSLISHVLSVSCPRDTSGHSRMTTYILQGQAKGGRGWALQNLWMRYSLAPGKVQCKCTHSVWEVAVKWKKKMFFLSFCVTAWIKAPIFKESKYICHHKKKMLSHNKNKTKQKKILW